MITRSGLFFLGLSTKLSAAVFAGRDEKLITAKRLKCLVDKPLSKVIFWD
jgi:hypothetical protein